MAINIQKAVAGLGVPSKGKSSSKQVKNMPKKSYPAKKAK
jgi:hypothetical protein